MSEVWKDIRGELATGAKLTEPQVQEIKSKLASGQSGASVASEFGMSQTAISQIKTGKRWVHV